MTEPTLEADELFLLAEKSARFTWRGRSLQVSLRQGGKGRSLLMLSGFWAGAGTFRPLLAGLRRRFEVAIPEMDLAGAQDLITDSGRLADGLGALADALGLGQALWLAQGECALGALQLGLQRPQLMSGLVLLSPPVEIRRRFTARHVGLLFAAGRRAWARRASARPFETARRLLADADPLLLSRPLLRQQARRWDTWPAALGLAELLGSSLRPAFRRELLELLERRLQDPRPFPAPLYLIFGERDGQSHRRGRSLLARAFPGAQLATLPDAGRLPQLEQPQAVLNAVFSLA